MEDKMEERIELRVLRDLKRKLQDNNVNISGVCREALEKAAGVGNDIESLMADEEEKFGDWADSFIRLYQFVNRKLDDRDALVLAESKKLEEIWKKIEQRMKTREQLMEEVPELKVLTYEDIFDWKKMFKIIELYPKTLQGRLGVVQIRECILYREVRKGNFTGIQEARDKLKAELELRAQKTKEELQAYTSSEEFKKQWMAKQEELRLQEKKRRDEKNA